MVRCTNLRLLKLFLLYISAVSLLLYLLMISYSLHIPFADNPHFSTVHNNYYDHKSQHKSVALEPVLRSKYSLPLHHLDLYNQRPPNISISGETLTILLWSERFVELQRPRKLDWWNQTRFPCSTPLSQQCKVTTDRTLLASSDAVVFQARSLYQLLNDRPPQRLPHQMWVLYNSESLFYLFNNQSDVEMAQDMFNYTMHYTPEADIFAPYGHCRLKSDQRKIEPVINYAKGKSGMVTWFMGRCSAASERIGYAKELHQAGVKLDIYGGCGSMKIPMTPKCAEDKIECEDAMNVLNQYKFYLSFENSLCDYYMTEKVFKTLLPSARIVPIVLGSGPYENMLPPHSYIDVRDFSTARELSDYLHYLDTHDDAYNDFFKWREHYTCELLRPHCVLCDAVHKLRYQRHRSETNLTRLFSPQNKCEDPSSFYSNIVRNYTEWTKLYKLAPFKKTWLS